MIRGRRYNRTKTSGHGAKTACQSDTQNITVASAIAKPKRPKRGTQRPDKWEQLVRDPTCRHYESCMDHYAALDASGRPMTLHSKEHPGVEL